MTAETLDAIVEQKLEDAVYWIEAAGQNPQDESACTPPR